MDNNHISAAEMKGTKTSHEYIRDIIPFSYQECISCGYRTDLICMKCGYCYSCHWNKEKEERRLLEDRIAEIFPAKEKGADSQSTTTIIRKIETATDS